jgi:1-acyl-sn-glycerol-3-phosphate acyltransferase
MAVIEPGWEQRFLAFGRRIDAVCRPFMTVQLDVQAPLPDGPVLMAANHHSFVDMIVAVICCTRLNRPTRLIVKGSFFTKPILGRFLRRTGCIAGGRKSGADVVAAEAIAEGVSCAIMPEGKITLIEPGRVLAPLLPGVASIWTKAACPFVAVGIAGAHGVWPKGRPPRLPKRRSRRPVVMVRVAVPDVGVDGERTLERVAQIMEANCVASEAARSALVASTAAKD